MVRLAALAVLAVCFVGVESASATTLSFKAGDELGKFTVEVGELTDTVSYDVSWRTSNGCWTSILHDKGEPSMRWSIVFLGNKKARVAKLKLQRLGELTGVRLPSNWLLASGTAQREWSGSSNVYSDVQPGSEDECNSPHPPPKPQPQPPDDAATCGNDAIHMQRTFLFLVPGPHGHDRYGSSAELSGTPVPSEGLSLGLCPFDSKLTGNVTALPVLEGAVSPNALSKLALASPGERVQISGHVGQRQLVPLQPGPGDFFFPSPGWTDIDSNGNRIPVSGAGWVGGRYTAASFHWTLILKKVK